MLGKLAANNEAQLLFGCMEMSSTSRLSIVSGLIGVLIGASVTMVVMWAGPVMQRERALLEIEKILQEYDAHRDDGCVIEGDGASNSDRAHSGPITDAAARTS